MTIVQVNGLSKQFMSINVTEWVIQQIRLKTHLLYLVGLNGADISVFTVKYRATTRFSDGTQ